MTYQCQACGRIYEPNPWKHNVVLIGKLGQLPEKTIYPCPDCGSWEVEECEIKAERE